MKHAFFLSNASIWHGIHAVRWRERKCQETINEMKQNRNDINCPRCKNEPPGIGSVAYVKFN